MKKTKDKATMTITAHKLQNQIEHTRMVFFVIALRMACKKKKHITEWQTFRLWSLTS